MFGIYAKFFLQYCCIVVPWLIAIKSVNSNDKFLRTNIPRYFLSFKAKWENDIVLSFKKTCGKRRNMHDTL